MFPTDSSFETEVTLERESEPIPDDPPFHILLLGDWSGRESRLSTEEITISSPILIDRDNFDDVFRRVNVSLNLYFPGDNRIFLKFHFNELDDFHPDRIFHQIPLFSDLRNLRSRLLDPQSFEQAAADVRLWFDNEDQTVDTDDNPLSPADNQKVFESDNLLDQILSQSSGETISTKPTQATHFNELNKLISRIVEGHIIATDEDEQTRLLSVVDEATSELMRVILHHPHFQALEAAWRGVFMLVRQIETDVDLKLFLLDISKAELGANLKSVSSLSNSLLSRWLLPETAESFGGHPFAVICGNYTFDITVEDIATLIRLAKLSKDANAPFLSQIRPPMFGTDSLTETSGTPDWKPLQDSDERKLWLTLRGLPEAEFLGLAMPRFLARIPYGKASLPTESFIFEEFPEYIKHNDYLWANSAFLTTLLLAHSFRAYRWDMGTKLFQSLKGLPMHIYTEDGETRTQPSAEFFLTETAVEMLLDEGFMPLVSFRDSDRIQLARFQSISSPLKHLGGRWK